MLKVLFIEDEPASVETVIEELSQKLRDVECKVEGFQEAESLLESFSPDIVILDIFKGPIADNDRVGLGIYDSIWNRRFCPLIIYSARPDDVSEEVQEHPFIQLVQKGANSEARVISHIEAFLPHVEALNQVQSSIREHVNRELKNTAPRVFQTITDTKKRRAVFVRAARRRIAAMMDQPSKETVVCWEQYLYPPVGSSLLMGDIIRKKEEDGDKAEHYSIVLTPSCDLVGTGARTPKVDKVLVARCTHIKNVLPEVSISSGTGEANFKKRLLPLLYKGYGTYCLPLPELPGVLPPMTAELKKLQLIDLNLIGEDEGCEYCRVASVDSPFREMITWAYLQVTGRPGLPDRDFDDWADHIYQTVSQGDQGGDA